VCAFCEVAAEYVQNCTRPWAELGVLGTLSLCLSLIPALVALETAALSSAGYD
jgi:hypothetical protein